MMNSGLTSTTSGGGFTFGSSTPSLATTSTATSGTVAPSATSFGSNVTTPVASVAQTSTATGTTGGFNLSAIASSTATVPQTSLGPVTTVSSSTSSGQQSGTINFCQLEESINKWTLELEEHEKVFINQANQINVWDKLLIANGDKIVTLNKEVDRVKLEQDHLDQELNYVVSQQKELQDCLAPLEKELENLSVSDPEREYTYRLAENLDTQLKRMSEDLKEIIEHLNEANRAQDSSDPIVQIGKILNAHMNSLQWLESQTTLLNQRIQQIDQMHQNFRQENERTFSLAYN